MLQGPIGPFFRRFARRLMHEGHEVTCVAFNFGDALFNRDGHILHYRGSQAAYVDWLTKLHAKHNFTDVVLYNDCRFYHAKAIGLLKPLGVDFHMFEEGYFRPHMVTYERDGLNGHSFFYPCSREKIENNAPRVPCPKAPKPRDLPPAMRHIYMNAIIYYTAVAASLPFYPFYRSHRKWHPLTEAAHWIGRLLNYKVRERQSLKKQGELTDGNYYLLLLQLSQDSQIRVHSDYSGGMRQVIAETVKSFADNAPQETTLVIKNHPLDNGVDDLEAYTQKCAESHGVTGRIVYLDKGHLPGLIKGCRGAVLVNSTSGTSVLHHGKPLKCLGRAIYDCPELTFDGPLHAFWQSDFAPDMILFEKLRAAVCARTQLFGGYYTVPGVECVLGQLMRFAPFSADMSAPQISDAGVCLSNAAVETK